MFLHRWFGLFTTLKCVVVGMAIALVTSPLANCALIFALYLLNFVLLCVLAPHGDLYVAASDTFTSATEAAQIGATTMAVLGTFSGPYVEVTLLILTALGFLPCLVATIIQTVNTLYTIFTETIWAYLRPVTEPIENAIINPVLTKAEELKNSAVASVLHCLGIEMDEDKNQKVEYGRTVLEENLDMERLDECLPGEEAEIAAVGAAGAAAAAATTCPKDAWLQKLRETFALIDEDGDGKLQRIEVQHALKRNIIKATLVRNDVLMSRAMFEKFFAAMDTDHDGVISFEEFVTAIIHSGAYLEGVDANELAAHLKARGPRESYSRKTPVFKGQVQLTATLLCSNSPIGYINTVQGSTYGPWPRSPEAISAPPANASLQILSNMSPSTPCWPPTHPSVPGAGLSSLPAQTPLSSSPPSSTKPSMIWSSVRSAAGPVTVSPVTPLRNWIFPSPRQISSKIFDQSPNGVRASAGLVSGEATPTRSMQAPPTLAVQPFSSAQNISLAFPSPQRPQLNLAPQNVKQVTAHPCIYACMNGCLYGSLLACVDKCCCWVPLIPRHFSVCAIFA
jgi:hypothetical protein